MISHALPQEPGVTVIEMESQGEMALKDESSAENAGMILPLLTESAKSPTAFAQISTTP